MITTYMTFFNIHGTVDYENQFELYSVVDEFRRYRVLIYSNSGAIYQGGH